MGRQIRRRREWLAEWVSHHRILVSALGAVIFYALASPSSAALVAGSVVALAGEAMRTWASGYLRKNEQVSRDGPYRYTRHPLYLGNFFLGLGFVVMGGRLWLIPLYALAFGWVYWATIRDEEVGLLQRFGTDYKAYCSEVPGFFPRWIPGRGEAGRFEWTLVWKHREHHTWLGILIGVLCMSLRPLLPF